MVLNGLTKAAKNSVTSISKNKVNVCRYADEFVVTGYSRELLEENVRPAIQKYLLERGLKLKLEETMISHVSEGVDFLGYNFRRYIDEQRKSGHILLVKPSKEN